ncbi:NADH:flavin oxidoreductase/NADH oxidase family protein [Curvivirga sp.]|uniref:NADH:flavin oxidoreductase/NADH oxidase family protein n=1 Tax=Curvivirga sp. TaxID=2856848 RepID=UPI003B5A232F
MIEQPLKLPNGTLLRNRIVKSAMSEALADAHNNTTDGHINLFERWGKGGAALLITGNTPVDRWHLEHAGNFVLDEKTDAEQTRRLTTAAKKHGAKILAQLAHAGRQVPEAINPTPLSVSELKLDLAGYGQPKSATEEELQATIEKFVTSAGLAKDYGFDGVQIHAAHGYLLSSSLSPRINMRDDEWGGSLGKRARLVLSVVRAVREKVGKDFIVAVKLNSSDFQKGGFSHEDSIETAKMLEREGVDFIEISGGNFETPVAYAHKSKQESTKIREAYFLEYAKDIKAALDIPVMVTGGFRSREVMENALTNGDADLIGIGRPFIIDPEFPSKLFAGDMDVISAVERDFPPAQDLPKGAVLNWFCHQLALHGTTGDSDLSVPVVEGHEKYLDYIETSTKRLLEARG